MEAWKFRGGWGILLGFLLGFLLGGGLLFRAEAIAAITAGPGYEVAVFATGLQHPIALAFGPQLPFGGILYLVERGSGQETGRLVALDSLGQATSLAEGLRSPLGLVFSPGGAWGSFAYLLAGQGGLGLVRVSPLGTVEVSHALPGGARAVGGIVLSPEGPWGEALYLSDAAEGTLVRMGSEGTLSVFLKGLSGPRSLALAPAGPFGPALFVADGTAGMIYRIAPVGR